MKTYDEPLDDERALIEKMKSRPIDYTDIPKFKPTADNPYRPLHQDILDKLPPDIVKELARRCLDEREKMSQTESPPETVIL